MQILAALLLQLPALLLQSDSREDLQVNYYIIAILLVIAAILSVIVVRRRMKEKDDDWD